MLNYMETTVLFGAFFARFRSVRGRHCARILRRQFLVQPEQLRFIFSQRQSAFILRSGNFGWLLVVNYETSAACLDTFFFGSHQPKLRFFFYQQLCPLLGLLLLVVNREALK